jgi:hypothetical protein
MKRPRDRRTTRPAKAPSRSAVDGDADHVDDDPPSDVSMRLPILTKPILRSVSPDRVQGLFGALTTLGVDGVVSAAVLRVAGAVVLRGNRP